MKSKLYKHQPWLTPGLHVVFTSQTLLSVLGCKREVYDVSHVT